MKDNKVLQEKIILLRKLGLGHEDIQEYGSLALSLGYVSKIKGLDSELGKVTSRYSLATAVHNKKSVIALYAAREAEFMPVLEKHGFSSIEISDVAKAGHNWDQTLKSAHKKEIMLQNEEQELIITQKQLKGEWAGFLTIHEMILSEEAEKAEAPLRCGATDDTFLINGWVPTLRLERTVKALEAASKKSIYITTEKVDNLSEIPIQLENPKGIRPFEFFMRLYTLPKYKEIDPTFFVFLSFPLFFGFMLGDMGYGLTTLVIFLLLRKKFSIARNFFNILIYSSAATILFGALFGEVFGEEIIFGFHLPHVLSRAHQINELLYLAVAIGIIHINLGLLIGFYNKLRAHGFKHAILEKFSWIILETGIALGLLFSPKLGIAVAAISIIMIYLGEGFRGIIELPGLFSNMLSYARLMAIGLASVQLAMLVNEFAKEFIHQGGFAIIGAVLILVLGHTVNILLGLLGPFLHSLRLQYVEFFSKFFEGGGKEYSPFGYKD